MTDLLKDPQRWIDETVPTGALVRRTLDATFLNEVFNDPDVRPWVGGEGVIDVTTVVSNPANIALITEHGGWVLAKHETGIYELHTAFLKEGRGRFYVAATLEALRYVFTATDAVEIVTRVPEINRAAAMAARCAGFKERFMRSDAWALPEGKVCDISFQGLHLDAWTAQSPDVLAEGHWFHETLEAAKTRSGSPLAAHRDDGAHDRAVGASVLMMKTGNAAKAVWSYNRWARLAGYQPIELLGSNPVIVDVGDAVVEVMGADMQVLKCR